MAFTYDAIKNRKFEPVEQHYSEKDTMLYALALGYGCEPTNAEQLQFVYEKGLRALPFMAVVLGYPGFWMQDPSTGIDWVKILHGEQRLRLHRPLPSSGRVIGYSKIKSIVDKGASKGAIVVTERVLRSADSGEDLATIEQVSFLRGNGGFSTPEQPGDTLESYPNAIADRAPDHVVEISTRPEMALIYRLCADDNALHADPAVARAAGFDRPILHGLASYGVAGRAILAAWCGNDPARLHAFNARFTAPVYPGETLRVESWKENGAIGFRVYAAERNLMVLNNGYAEIS